MSFSAQAPAISAAVAAAGGVGNLADRHLHIFPCSPHPLPHRSRDLHLNLTMYGECRLLPVCRLNHRHFAGKIYVC